VALLGAPYIYEISSLRVKSLLSLNIRVLASFTPNKGARYSWEGESEFRVFCGPFSFFNITEIPPVTTDANQTLAPDRIFMEFSDHVIYSFIPLACAELDDSLQFSGASSIPLCYVLFPATLPHQLFFNPLSPHPAIYFLVYLSILLFPNSCIILFWGILFPSIFCTCPNQRNLLTLLSLL